MRRRLPWIIANGLVLAVMAGCSQWAAPDQQGAASPPLVETQAGEMNATALITAQPEADQTHGAEKLDRANRPTPPNPVQQSLVLAAKENLAQQLGIAPDTIQLVSAETVNWSDDSLGCPQPGMLYVQVITPGFRVVLEAEGERYTYHTDKRQRVVYCEPEGARRLLSDKSTETVNLAKEDLARRLEISTDSIDIVAVIRQEFPVDAFYCRTTKERIARDEPLAVIPGESILLRAAGRKYEYHASDQTVIFCQQLR